MDINGDGRKDLITGCFEGNVYVIAGLEDGKFAKPEPLKDADDNLIRLGQYWHNEDRKWTKIPGPLSGQLAISSQAIDFDGDGDLDLLSGSNSGYFFFRENIGSVEEAKFATVATQILVGTTIKEASAFAKDSEEEDAGEDSDEESDDDSESASPPETLKTVGHAMPFVADWDGDGNFDILSGASAGGVFWARNVGTKFEPKFEQMATLIEPGVTNEEDLAVGSRSQVCVVDFNNDGKLDVVVGDYNRSKPQEQTEEQKAMMTEYIEMAQKVAAISKSLKKLEVERKKADEPAEDDEQSADSDAKSKNDESDNESDEAKAPTEEELRKQYSEMLAEMTELRGKLPSSSSTRHGYVWLFEQE